MANTPDEIFRIHTRHLATPGKKYFRDDGTVFIGTNTNRLKILEDADQTSFDPGQNFESNNVQGAIDELQSQLTTLSETIINISDEVNTLRIKLDIDGTIVGSRMMYTVPTAQKLLVSEIYAVLTNVSGGTGLGKYPIMSAGILPGYEDIYKETKMFRMDTADDLWHFNTSGKGRIVKTGETFYIDIKTPSNATAYQMTIYLYGSLIQ